MNLLHVKLMPPDCHVSVLKHVEMFSFFSCFSCVFILGKEKEHHKLSMTQI